MSKAVKNKPIIDNIYFFDKKTNESKSKFDIISRDLRYILRAADPKKLSSTQKPLSRGAQTLLVNYYDMINKAANKAIFVSHEFISSITVVGNSQNKRYHNELKDLFNIQYHQSVIIDGKKYRDGFAIELPENTENILKNPKLFYSTQNTENERLSVQKRTPRCSKKDASLHIEENPLENLKDRSIEIPENIPPEKELEKSNFLEKSLKDFHPLFSEDGDQLKTLSGRAFSLNAMNEILLDMSKRYPDHSFKSKNRFMKYFGDCLRREMRDAVKTANETFKIKSNLTEEDKENQRIYKYLEKVEYSLEVSPELHFQKKLACVLADKKAYNLLTSYKALVIKDHIAKLYLRKMVELTPNELEIVLNQIKASHSDAYVEKLELIPEKPEIKMQNNNLDTVILQKFGSVKGQDIIKNCSIKKLPTGKIEVQNKFSESLEGEDKDLLKTCIKQVYGENVGIIAAKEKFYSSDENELWKQFKEFTQKHFRSNEDANAVLSSWFAKLKPSQNIGSNKLIFIGSEFMIDWVESNYSSLIETAVKELKINIELIYENNCKKPILYESGIGRFKRLDEETMNRLMNQKINTEEEK